jgi:predicted dehydrogenase
VLAIEPKLTRPMFFEAHRLSVFTPRSLDVDVVLDLMIHDLDIVLTFAGSPVKEVRAVGLPILSPKVDIANVRVEFESGCVANFTASRVSTERVRKLRFFEPRQYVSIDYARRDLLVIAVDPGFSIEQAMAMGAASGFADGLPGLSFSKPQVTPGEPLKLEIASFLDSVRSGASLGLRRGRGARRWGWRWRFSGRWWNMRGRLGWGISSSRECELGIETMRLPIGSRFCW